MGFRIQNNIEAMNAQRQLQISGSQLTKSLERLSSGYRINRAADDAAGLAISSSFRANIASFKVASRNTSEANALLQVAEGGMDQINNMLTRLKELATQAASANSGTAERTKINAEGNALISEIDRIANSTKYGSTKLLDGTFGAQKESAATALANTSFIGTSYNTYSAAVAGDVVSAATVAAAGSGVAEGSWYLFVLTGDTTSVWAANASTFSTAGIAEKISIGTTTGATSLNFANVGLSITFTAATSLTTQGMVASGTGGGTSTSGFTITKTGLTSMNVADAVRTGTYTITDTAGSVNITNGTESQTITFAAATAATYDFSELGVTFTVGTDYGTGDLAKVASFTVSMSDSGSADFQIGAENNTDNRISLAIGNATATEVGGLGLTMDQLTTAANAQTMLTTVDAAISTLGDVRGDIGASMNRLAYAAANLSTTIENTQAAESVIRDVDMAAEMTTFTKNQILQQAGTAMLSQANQAPQLILSLFQ
jgi:flagellin